MKKSLAIGDPISSATRLAAAAKKRGYELIEFRTFSKDSEYYQRSYDGSLFDSVYEYRGDDAHALHALRDTEHIIIGADSSVQFVERLNLFRGQLENDPSKILARADKVEQARHFHAAGLPVVPQHYFSDLDSAMKYATGRRFPQVLKPRASGGTNNVLLARNEVEFKASFLRIVSARSLYDRPNGGVLVMDYVDPELADEFVVDAVSCQGRHVLTDIWQYEKAAINGTPAMYRAMRLVPWKDVLSESLFAFSMLDAAGYRQGASHTELWRLPGNQNIPVEVGFRLPGLITAVSTVATGRDQVELTLDSVLDPDQFHRKASSFEGKAVLKSAAVVFLAARRAGLLKKEVPVSAIQSLRSYHSSAIKATRIGERLARTVDLATIVGWVALCHEDATVVQEDIATLQAMENEIAVAADEPTRSDLAA
jgi:hypothetical protein